MTELHTTNACHYCGYPIEIGEHDWSLHPTDERPDQTDTAVDERGGHDENAAEDPFIALISQNRDRVAQLGAYSLELFRRKNLDAASQLLTEGLTETSDDGTISAEHRGERMQQAIQVLEAELSAIRTSIAEPLREGVEQIDDGYHKSEPLGIENLHYSLSVLMPQLQSLESRMTEVRRSLTSLTDASERYTSRVLQELGISDKNELDEKIWDLEAQTWQLRESMVGQWFHYFKRRGIEKEKKQLRALRQPGWSESFEQAKSAHRSMAYTEGDIARKLETLSHREIFSYFRSLVEEVNANYEESHRESQALPATAIDSINDDYIDRVVRLAITVAQQEHPREWISVRPEDIEQFLGVLKQSFDLTRDTQEGGDGDEPEKRERIMQAFQNFPEPLQNLRFPFTRKTGEARPNDHYDAIYEFLHDHIPRTRRTQAVKGLIDSYIQPFQDHARSLPEGSTEKYYLKNHIEYFNGYSGLERQLAGTTYEKTFIEHLDAQRWSAFVNNREMVEAFGAERIDEGTQFVEQLFRSKYLKDTGYSYSDHQRTWASLVEMGRVESAPYVVLGAYADLNARGGWKRHPGLADGTTRIIGGYISRFDSLDESGKAIPGMTELFDLIRSHPDSFAQESFYDRERGEEVKNPLFHETESALSTMIVHYLENGTDEEQLLAIRALENVSLCTDEIREWLCRHLALVHRDEYNTMPGCARRYVLEAVNRGDIAMAQALMENATGDQVASVLNESLSSGNLAGVAKIFELADRSQVEATDAAAQPSGDSGLSPELLQDLSQKIKAFIQEHPAGFVGQANRELYREVFGREPIDAFLDALPTDTDEKRNAFTHNQYDRATAFVQHMTASQDGRFSLDAEQWRYLTEYVKQFKLSKTPALYHHFVGLRKHVETGQPLTEEQLQTGIATEGQLVERFRSMRERTYGTDPILETGDFTKFDLELLSAVSGKSTHRFDTGRPSMEQIVADFQEARDHGRIAELPAEYKPFTLSLQNVEIQMQAEKISHDFDQLQSEILNVLDGRSTIETLRERVQGSLQTEIDQIEQSLMKKSDNQFIRSRLEQLRIIGQAVQAAGDADSLMGALLEIDLSTGKKLDIFPTIRETILRRLIDKNYSALQADQLAATLRGGLSVEGVLRMLTLHDDFIKDHVLNVNRKNEEHYWSDQTWDKIQRGRKSSKHINLSKAFEPHIGVLREASRNMTVIEQGSAQKIDVIPDRGLIGELSGYLADVCYTAETKMLERFPNVVPFKFTARDAETGEAEFIGSVLIFELSDAAGDPVMLVRGFDVPHEEKYDIPKFMEKFMDQLQSVARQRGIKKIVLPGMTGAMSNYAMTNRHVEQAYKQDKQAVGLSEKFAFNGYDITDNVYVARDLNNSA